MFTSCDGVELKEIMDRYGLKIAVAESLTTGNIQAAIGAVSGSSTFFEGGVTAYQLKHKVSILNVDEEHASSVNSVSQRVAMEMAKGVAVRFGTDLGIGTTGYAEPDASNGVAAPYAYIAIWRRDHMAFAGGVIAEQCVIGTGLTRVDMQHHVTAFVLHLLVDYLRMMDASGSDALCD